MSKYCEELHRIFNSMKRLKYPYEDEYIPQNGIYVLFEKGEMCHENLDRIVRVGTHRGDKQLRSRLNEHFINENKDRSIFRKNIGRAILNKNNDEFIKYWELDLTPSKNREKYSNIIDFQYQKKIEGEVTRYIQEMFSFVVIEINDREMRLFYESKIISEVSNCKECFSSENWLGRYSPKEKIRESGLWQENKLYIEGFSKEEFDEFTKLVKKYLY